MSILCFIALRLITQHDDPWKAIEEGRRITRELCSNSYQRNAADYFQRTVMAAFLLRILQKADYFGRRTSESGKYFLYKLSTNSIKFIKIILNLFLSLSK